METDLMKVRTIIFKKMMTIIDDHNANSPPEDIYRVNGLKDALDIINKHLKKNS